MWLLKLVQYNQTQAQRFSLSRNLKKSWIQLSSVSTQQTGNQNIFSNSNQNNIKRTDMEDLYLDRRVQYLLKALTGFDPLKIFNKKSLDNLNSPKYRFLTDEQLEQEKNSADSRADSMLQMPPIKYSREFKPRIFEKDIAIQGLIDPSVKVIFVDATPGFADNNRLIVVREADGTLREATREERHRSNQIFYPVEERHIDIPKMFEEPNTTNMFNRGAYKLFLDNLCLHYEPDDPVYNDFCWKVYEHVAINKNFDHLRFTRHYGNMVFHYVFQKNIDPLLFHLIVSERFNEAYHLLRLFYIVNSRDQVPKEIVNSFSEAQLKNESITLICKIEQSAEPVALEKLEKLLKIYIKFDSQSNLKSQLKLVLQKLMEENEKLENEAQN